VLKATADDTTELRAETWQFRRFRRMVWLAAGTSPAEPSLWKRDWRNQRSNGKGDKNYEIGFQDPWHGNESG
jgi:hypothetical protein